ncbi:MAG: alpha/beta hydrolase [Pseudomonadales bacterium]|nr:alpha/beta hydrolase [Pseudomonadales bacterium]
MPFLQSNDVQIYYETVGQGTPLFLYHGLGDSSQGWYEFGYVDGLLKGRQLILIDGRGHGQSQKLPQPSDYCLEHCVADVINLANHLKINRFDFLGSSMGGWVGLGLACYVPARLSRLIVNGAHGFAQDLTPLRALLNSLEQWATFVSAKAGLTDVQTKRLLDNDLAAMRAVVANDRPDLSQGLNKLICPSLILMGSDDPAIALARKTAQLMFDGRFVELVGRNHFSAITDSEAVLNHLNLFYENHPTLMRGIQ